MSVGDPVPSERRFGLGTALGISLLLHLLLATMGYWLPAMRSEDQARPDPEDAAMNVTFLPEPLEAPELHPAGDVPVPAPTSPPLPPAPSAAVPTERPQEGPEVLAKTATSSERTEQPIDAGGAEHGSAVDVSGERSSAAQVAVPESVRGERPRLDLGRAVHDFGETLEQSRPDLRRGTAPAGTFVPDAGQFPTTGYGMGNLTFETRDFDWSDYARQIYIAIWRTWHRRLYETVDDFEKWAYSNGWFLNHENRIRFVIEKSGQVSGIAVEGGSGCEPLDLSATQALAEVILPPLPSDFPKEREVVHARFLAEGRIHDMRPVLSTLKRYGLF